MNLRKFILESSASIKLDLIDFTLGVGNSVSRFRVVPKPPHPKAMFVVEYHVVEVSEVIEILPGCEAAWVCAKLLQGDSQHPFL